MKSFLCGSILLIIISCSSKRSKENSNDFSQGKKLAQLKNKKLREVSGLAASKNNPGLFWTHNDSGNGPEIFLIDKDLHIEKTFTLQGVKNRDWEDIAVGPGPDPAKNYVYVAEIGDNDAVYQLKYIYRFEEPGTNSPEKSISISEFDRITFQLPNTRKDTETLMIDPRTKDLFIVSKRENPVHVYKLEYPYSTTDTITAVDILSLPLTQIVAGSFSPDGTEMIMKNYNHIYYWKNPSNKSIVELLKDLPLEIPYEIEPQGESLAWSIDNSGFYTLSEQNQGRKSFLYFYKRK